MHQMQTKNRQMHLKMDKIRCWQEYNESHRARKKSRRIDRNLRIDAKKRKKTHRIILLDFMDSGLSRESLLLMTRISIVPRDGFSRDQLLAHRDTVRKAILDMSHEVVMRMVKNDSYDAERGHDDTLKPQKEDFYRHFRHIEPDGPIAITPDIVAAISRLHTNPELLSCVELSALGVFNCFYLPHFYQDIQRIAQPDYIPTESDIVRAVRSTCPQFLTGGQVSLGVGNRDLNLISLPRSMERRKWIHVVDDCTALIYIVDMIPYDGMIEGELLTELIILLDSTTNSSYFGQRPVIVILNNLSAFKEKLIRVPFGQYCSGYTGDDNDVKSIIGYILQQLKQVNQGRNKIYPYQVDSLDSINWAHILKDINGSKHNSW